MTKWTCSSARRGTGRFLSSILILIATFWAGASAWAQDADPDEGADGSENAPLEMELIHVTGSRILRDPARERLTPTEIIDGDAMNDRGFLNLGEALNDNPWFSSTGVSDTDFNQSAADIGLTFVDLFGLGSQRTLTVINGLRTVSSSAPQPNRAVGDSGLQVDVNSIPSVLIDRIETISVGGAPIYGADAIAGTVNVILRDDFNGIEADLQGGQSWDSDAENYRGRIVWGSDFAGGDGNIAVAGEYFKQEGLIQTARPGANDIQVSNPLLATDPITFFTTVPPLPLNTFQRATGFPGVSAFGTPVSPAIGGAFGTGIVFGDLPLGFVEDASGNVLMFDETGSLITVPVGAGNGTFLFSQDQADYPGLYRGQDYVALLNETERAYVSVLGHYDFTRHVRGSMRIHYSELDASNLVSSPTVLGTPLLQGIATSLDNPFLSAASRSALESSFVTLGPGVVLPFTALGRGLTVGKSLSEFPTDGVSAESDNFSAVFTLEGDFMFRDSPWIWQVALSTGSTETTNTSPGVISSRFYQAADAVMIDPGTDGAPSIGDTIITDPTQFADFSSFAFDPSIGAYVSSSGNQQIACRSRVDAGATPAPDAGCMPFNPFGAQNPDEVIAHLAGMSILNTDIDQSFLQAHVTGDLFDLPAGPLGAVFGFEYREEESSFSTDPLTRAGAFIGAGAPSDDVSGDFDSTELFFEVAAPLVNWDSGGLTFEGAYRWIDNSQSGSDGVWTAGLTAEVIPALKLRGNLTHSVRSPSIAELFAGQAPVFTSIADPCAVGNLTSGSFTEQRTANCIQAVIDAGLAGSEQAASDFLLGFTGAIGGVPGIIGGNPDLENEEADSWSVGVVVTPESLPGLSFNVDLVNIEIEGAIANLSGTQVVTSCYDSPAFPGFAGCGNFTRDAGTFNLASFQAGFINSGFVDFAAITSGFRWQFDFAGGQAGLYSNIFYLDKYESSIDDLNVTDELELVGRERWRVQTGVNYALGRWDFLAVWNHTSGAWLSAAERDGDANVFEFDQTDDANLFDFSVGFDITDNLSARVVVQNAFEDEQPEQLRQFASVQARIGRTWSLGLTGRFD